MPTWLQLSTEAVIKRHTIVSIMSTPSVSFSRRGGRQQSRPKPPVFPLPLLATHGVQRAFNMSGEKRAWSNAGNPEYCLPSVAWPLVEHTLQCCSLYFTCHYKFTIKSVVWLGRHRRHRGCRAFAYPSLSRQVGGTIGATCEGWLPVCHPYQFQ